MTTFTDPVKAGTIIDTSGSTIGQNIANVGTAVLVQKAAITQVSGATAVVIPAGSTILSMALFVTTAWTGSATTMGIGNTASATAYTVATAVQGSTLGLISITPGSGATQIGNWANTGTSDVEFLVTSGNTGSGVGTLFVTYLMTAVGT